MNILNWKDLIVLFILVLYFFFTIIKNINYKQDVKIIKWDIIGVIPVWRFFAPIPGQFDYYLLYREIYNNKISNWTEVKLNNEREWFNFLWNPNKRIRKALVDIATDISKERNKQNNDVLASIPYLILLNFVSTIPRLYSIEKVQFLILVFKGVRVDDNPEILFISNFHKHD